MSLFQYSNRFSEFLDIFLQLFSLRISIIWSFVFTQNTLDDIVLIHGALHTFELFEDSSLRLNAECPTDFEADMITFEFFDR